jgi:hypothetical protein
MKHCEAFDTRSRDVSAGASCKKRLHAAQVTAVCGVVQGCRPQAIHCPNISACVQQRLHTALMAFLRCQPERCHAADTRSRDVDAGASCKQRLHAAQLAPECGVVQGSRPLAIHCLNISACRQQCLHTVHLAAARSLMQRCQAAGIRRRDADADASSKHYLRALRAVFTLLRVLSRYGLQTLQIVALQCLFHICLGHLQKHQQSKAINACLSAAAGLAMKRGRTTLRV